MTPSTVPPPVRSRLVSELFLVLATIIWGGTFAVTRAGLSHISPLLLIAVRFLGAAAIVGPVLAWRGRRWWRGAGRGVLLGLAVFAGYTMQTGGLAFTTAARSAFLTYLFAVFVPPLARIFSRRRLNPANVVGLGIVIVGATVMTQPWAAADWNVGDLITVGSAVAFAFFIVLVDRFSGDRDPIDFVPTQFLVAGVLSLVAALVFEPLRFEPGPQLWFALAYLMLLGTVGALGLQTIFQAGTTPIRATTIYALEPVFAAAMGVAFLSEHLAPLEITGAAIILAGVLFSELALLRRRLPPRATDTFWPTRPDSLP